LQQGINQVSRTILHRMSVHATFCLHNALKAIDGKWLSLCYSLATSSLAVAAIACSCGGFRIKWHISVRPDNVWISGSNCMQTFPVVLCKLQSFQLNKRIP
jgi:hypothetical protein